MIHRYLFTWMLIVSTASATIINVPADIDSIQGGINLASNGDTVLVQPGTYVENINFNGKNIVVGSLTLTTGDTSYISQTIIDGDSSGSVVTFIEGEDSSAVLNDFTLTNGDGTLGGNGAYGGGVLCRQSHPSLINLNVLNNLSRHDYWPWCDAWPCQYGGGLYFSSSNSMLVNVRIIGNNAHAGAGIYCKDSQLYLKNVVIVNNNSENSYSISGIFSYDCDLTLVSGTIAGHQSEEQDWGSAGIFAYSSSGSSSGTIKIINSVLWDSVPFEYNNADSSTLSMIAYSNIRGGESNIRIGDGIINWLEGNIDSDPLFADTANGDYRLQESSPCIDAGIPFFVWQGDTLVNLSPEEYVGSVPDMGAFEFGSVISIGDDSLLPSQYTLHQNYPNPFNPVSTIRYDLPQASKVSLIVYDILGREVARLVEGYIEPGYHQVAWHGRNANGRELPSGIYIAQMVTPVYTKSIKMLLLK